MQPIPSYFDNTVGHLFKVVLRRRGTSSQWECILCRVKSEDGQADPRLSLSVGLKKICNDNRVQVGCKVGMLYTGYGKFNFQIYGRRGFPRIIPFHLKDSESEILAQFKGPKGRGRTPKWRVSDPHAKQAAEYLAHSTLEKFMTSTNADFHDIHYIVMPNTFVKSCLPYQRSIAASCIIQDCNGKEWPMVIKFNTLKRKVGSADLANCMIRHGIKEFAQEHRIAKGTMLTFEMLAHEEPFLFRVKVFPKKE